MNDTDRLRLLGTYHSPKVHVGQTAFCLYRDCNVVITSIIDAPIPWPRCRAKGPSGGGSSLVVNEDLARAVRTESAIAIRHSFGVSKTAVNNWRRALGVKQFETPGSRKLLKADQAKAHEALYQARL